MVSRQSAIIFWAIPVCLLLYVWQGYFLHRSATAWLFTSFGGLLVGYGFLLKLPERWGWASGWLFRGCLLLATPWLSDDYVRFIWDGRLLANGVNPYLTLPSALVGTSAAQQAHLTDSLFRLLNSPHYYTVYPPFNQALFGLSAFFSGQNIFVNVIWLRIWILLAEAGTAWLLPRLLTRFRLPTRTALLYWLNPLVILELTGNLHFEAVMISLLLWAVWLLLRRESSNVGSAAVGALAIVTKLLPLLFMPLLIRRLGWKWGLLYALLVSGLTVALFAPFFSLDLVRNFLSSVNLYFQKFEFNASVYYLIREAGYWTTGYNIIETAGKVLSLATLMGVLWISFRSSWTTSLPLWILTFYFALATTVHPWYLTTLVAASVFSPYRFAIVWSGAVFLTYSAYGQVPYRENLWLTALEYGVVVLFAGWEWRKKTV